MDIEERIQKLKQEAAALCDGKMRAHVSPDCPAEIQEQFWKQVLAFEHAPEVQPFELLVQSGFSLPPQGDIDDSQLTVALSEAIRGMAALGMYLYSTDHLSDRELYAHLWSDVLREATP